MNSGLAGAGSPGSQFLYQTVDFKATRNGENSGGLVLGVGQPPPIFNNLRR